MKGRKELFTIALIWSTVRTATPLILAALGGLFSERSGVINIALEGMMLAGAFTAAAVTYRGRESFHRTGWQAWRRGWSIALIHAVVCIRYKADQVVTGTAINILMIGMPAFLSGAFFLSSGSTPQIPREQLIPRLPIVIAFALVLVTWYVLYKTPFGLRLRSVGENPEAADAAGVRVARMRYAGVLLSGVLAGIGRRVSLDWAVVVVYAQHDVGSRFHRAGGVDLWQVATCANDARLSVVWLYRSGVDSDAGSC